MAQESNLKGRVINLFSADPVSDVLIQLELTPYKQHTNISGEFNFKDYPISIGEHVLSISKQGYIPQRIPIVISKNKTIDLNPILLEVDLNDINSSAVIEISDDELDLDESSFYNVSGLLSSSKDVFMRSSAYDFSATFFRPRGLGNEYGKVLINGIEMNKLYNGRPQWSNWGGLNDVQRNKEFSSALKSNPNIFGGLAGTTNIVMRASKYRRGGKISYAASNRTYRGRLMGSYNSGILKNGWSYSILAARRYADEGYREATYYEANSFFISVEKKIGDNGYLNLASFYTPNRRAKATALTQEVRDLKGSKYNPNWGYLGDKRRNSRVRKINEPIVMLNHYWDINKSTSLSSSICYQFGETGNTRLDYGKNRNPAGNYYQRLPSYFLRAEQPSSYDYQLAYLAETEFRNNGKLDWASFYESNAFTETATYTIQDDKVRDTQIVLNSILQAKLSDKIELNGAISFRNLKSENYAELSDLLGGKNYLDVDSFGSGGIESNSDLQNPDRLVIEGERFKYNYNLIANVFDGFLQSEFKMKRFDSYLSLSVKNSTFQRNGLYQNGYFPEEGRSLGSSEKLSFTNLSAKGGINYKLSGRHLVDINLGYITNAPSLSNSFVNPRQNNDVVIGLENEKLMAADLSYIFRHPIIKARLSCYLIEVTDQSDISYFFTQNALGNEETSAFVQEVTTGVDQRNMGVELGAEAQLIPALSIKAVGALGQNVYTNNPYLYLAGDDFGTAGNDISSQGIRKVNLTNYRVSGGPEWAFQIGFDYRSSNYWWLGASANYFMNSYIGISKLRRTKDFYTDFDGQAFNDYDESIARQLLKQEKLDDYLLINMIGGKSWKVKGFYTGFFATISNVLDQSYKTGGFEDSRRASYRQQLEEQKRDKPIFGNRYFFGNGTTFFASVYVRF